MKDYKIVQPGSSQTYTLNTTPKETMFKETSEGQTHYENDNCGEPAHNKETMKEKWEEEFVQRFWTTLRLLPHEYRYAVLEDIKSFIKDRFIEKSRVEEVIQKHKVHKQATKINNTGADFIFTYDLRNFLDLK